MFAPWRNAGIPDGGQLKSALVDAVWMVEAREVDTGVLLLDTALMVFTVGGRALDTEGNGVDTGTIGIDTKASWADVASDAVAMLLGTD